MGKVDDLIKVLTLTNSSLREESMITLIQFIIFNIYEPVTLEEILTLIKTEFKLELDKQEVDELLNKLTHSNEWKIEGAKYFLSDDKLQELTTFTLNFRQDQKDRFKRFSNFIDELTKEKYSDSDKVYLSEVYVDYLYECFYQYGNDILNQFKDSNDDEDEYYSGTIDDRILKKAFDKFENEKLKEVFEIIINEFPKRISKEDLIFIESLADKAECFFSLGLSQSQYQDLVDLNVMNWTIFLDTNFLYSILGLDKHPEKEVCSKLVETINANKFNIRMCYTPETLQELRKKRRSLENDIPNINFTSSQLKALLASGRLDNVSKAYYENKLKDPQNTPHPVDLIDNAQRILSSKSINIYQADFSDVKDDHELMTKEFEQFSTYSRKINEDRIKKGVKEINRYPDKIRHDTLLRQSILSLRDGSAHSLNDVKFFGITLDKFLLKYDRHARIKNKCDNVPTFFSPSFLFEKIRKFLPVVTDDYKSAFISAISSQTFDYHKKSSVVVQKTVKYFHNMGITDQSLIMQYITDDIFLEEFNRKEGKERDVYVESEIQQYIYKLNGEKKKLENELNIKDKNLKIKEEKIKSVELSSKDELSRKDKDLKDLNELLEIYNKELKKLLEKVNEPKKEETKQLDLISVSTHEDEANSAQKNNDIKFLNINWDKNPLHNKTLNKILLISNLILFLFLILTAIRSNQIAYYLPVPLGCLTLIGIYKIGGHFEDWFKNKTILFVLLLVILLIFAYFIFHNYLTIYYIYFS
jgi:hypothetical protein